jgi:hypothetical protein
VLADERRVAAGAKIATLRELLGPRIIAKGVLTTARTGKMQGRVIGHPAQLGGAIVVAPGGEVVFSHMSEDAGDNASPREMLAAVRSAA